MAILGQADLGAGAETALYAPGANTQASVKVVVSNRNSALIAQVRIILRPGAGPTVAEDYLAFDEAIPALQSRVSAVFDIVNPEEVRVRSSIASVTAQANGIERST